MAAIHDLVLVYFDNKPGFYARIEEIVPDMKPGWWQVKLLALAFPLQVFTWVLDSSQIDGAPYTMGGTPVRLEPVISPVERPEESETIAVPQVVPESTVIKGRAKVVSLAERKNRK
jgi:hypothetical protein